MRHSKLTLIMLLALSLTTLNACKNDGGTALLGGTMDAPAAEDQIDDLMGGQHFYRGNFHSHSGISDGEGTATEAFLWARDTVGYDFYAVTDHAEQIMPSEWDDMAASARAFNKNGSFVALRGFEWSSPVYGHVCVWNTENYVNCLTVPSLKLFYAWLASQEGALAQFNHPGREQEVFSPIGSADDFSYSAKAAANFCAVETGNKDVGNNDAEYLERYHVALDKGWRLAPTTNQDNHTFKTNCHRTVVIAPELSREAICEALRARRVYSSDDPNLELIFKQGESWMGSVIETTEQSVTLTVKVVDDEPTQRLRLITNQGAVAAETACNAKEVVWQPSIELGAGTSYFYVEVTSLNTLDDDEPSQIAVSAPIWITRQ